MTADYWRVYGECLDRVAACDTVQAVIDALNDYYPPSSGVAFFPDGADRTLLSTLTDAGWTVVWMEAGYYYALRQPDGGSGFTYVEGDLLAGVELPDNLRYR